MDGFKRKKYSGVMGTGPENWHFLYPVALASLTPLQAGLSTRHYRQATATGLQGLHTAGIGDLAD